MSAPRLSKDQKNAIVVAYASGEKVADIAAKFGVDQSYATLLARRRGVPLRVPQRRRRS